jgi:hypothetical protein
VLIDQRHQLGMDPNNENELLAHGFPVTVQAMDNDVEHLKTHMQAAQALGPQGPHIDMFKVHILAHINQLNHKSQGASGGPQPPGQPGAGAQGQPRLGAPPGPPKPMQQPPGAIHQDAMQDPNKVPR